MAKLQVKGGGKSRNSYNTQVEQSGSYGQFDLLRVLGRGQVTEVFLARERGTSGSGSLLVIHRLLPHAAAHPTFKEAYLNHAGVTGTIKHPNIVEIFDLGEEEDQGFVAQEYVPGGSLHEFLDRSGQSHLELGEALYIIGEVCAGLQFAHAMADPDGVPRNLVHGAVNPRHVLVSVDGLVKVSDFGMRKALDLLGISPSDGPHDMEIYLPPEQREGGQVDRRADIYSSGAVLYRLVTGELPGSPSDGSLRAPRTIDPNFPKIIEDIILKAMAANPKDRHPTCGSLRRDLAKAARTLHLHGDISTLAALVRRQFPEATPQSSKPTLSEPPETQGQSSEDHDGAHTSDESLEDDDVPLLNDSQVIQITTGQFEALDTVRVEGLLEKDAEKVLAACQAEPDYEDVIVPHHRTLWIWLGVAALGGAVVAAGIILTFVFVFVLPALRSEPAVESPSPSSSIQPDQRQPGSAIGGATPEGVKLSGQPEAAETEPLAPSTPLEVASSPNPAESSLTGLPPEMRQQNPSSSDSAMSEKASSGNRPPSNRTSTSPSTRIASPSSSGQRTRRSSKRGRRSKGFIYVLTSPTSRVYMDSRLLGTTPIMNRAVPVGRHSIVMVSPGFPSKRIFVVVTPDGVTRVRHLFNR